MRRVVVVVANPVLSGDRDKLKTEVEKLTSAHPHAKLTWMQSASTRQCHGGGGVSEMMMVDVHVLTCAVEWDEPLGSSQPSVKKETARGKRRR